MQLRFQVQDFSWKFLLADVAFPILGVDFFRAHKLLIDPEGHALLDSTGQWFAGQLRRSLTTATVVIGFVQPYKPIVESSSSAHTARAASAGAASATREWAASAVADVKLPSGLSAATLSTGITADPGTAEGGLQPPAGRISGGGLRSEAAAAGQP